MDETQLAKKPFFWLSLSFILLFAFIFSLPDERLYLVFCQVGQGDAILISHKNNQVLVDGGPNKDVLDCLGENMPFWDRNLEMIILTHPEKDHFTGLIDVFRNYHVDYLVSTEVSNDSLGFKEFQKVVLEKKPFFYNPQKGDRLKIGCLDFLVLWPESKMNDKNFLGKNLNDTSLVLQLSFGKLDVLLTGDISSQIEKLLELSEVEILKVGHHGSRYSTSEEFLVKIKPKLAIICTGKNHFGHPHPDVLERLENSLIRVLRTDKDGSVKIVSDGKNYHVAK